MISRICDTVPPPHACPIRPLERYELELKRRQKHVVGGDILIGASGQRNNVASWKVVLCLLVRRYRHERGADSTRHRGEFSVLAALQRRPARAFQLSGARDQLTVRRHKKGQVTESR